MLNLHKVLRPLARIEGGTYNGMIVSVSDHFASNADDEDRNGLIKEFRQLKIAKDSKFQHVPDTTNIERDTLHHGTLWIREEHLHVQVSRAVHEEVQEQAHLLIF